LVHQVSRGGIDFDGKDYDPPGAFELRQPFELPSISKLVEKNATFELWRHRPDGSAPQLLTDNDAAEVEVRATFDQRERQQFAVFRSHHTATQQRVLGIDFLYNKPTVEKEALLTLYQPAEAEVAKSAAAVNSLHERWHDHQQPRTMVERAVFAQLATEQGAVEAGTSFGGGGTAALPYFMEAIDYTAEVPVNDVSPEALSVLCWYTEASARLVGIIKEHNPKRFAVPGNAAARLDRAASVAPTVPQLQRWLAWTRLRLANEYLADDSRAHAADALAAIRYGNEERDAAGHPGRHPRQRGGAALLDHHGPVHRRQAPRLCTPGGGAMAARDRPSVHPADGARAVDDSGRRCRHVLEVGLCHAG
jgi:hypothetical protein